MLTERNQTKPSGDFGDKSTSCGVKPTEIYSTTCWIMNKMIAKSCIRRFANATARNLCIRQSDGVYKKCQEERQQQFKESCKTIEVAKLPITAIPVEVQEEG